MVFLRIGPAGAFELLEWSSSIRQAGFFEQSDWLGFLSYRTGWGFRAIGVSVVFDQSDWLVFSTELIGLGLQLLDTSREDSEGDSRAVFEGNSGEDSLEKSGGGSGEDSKVGSGGIGVLLKVSGQPRGHSSQTVTQRLKKADFNRSLSPLVVV